jgi:hypothetical protein
MFAEEISDSTLQRLRNASQALLRLHKTLLAYERQAYERAGGRIGNNYQFLELVMRDKWFAWLHHLSKLVAQIDEMLDAKESPLESDAVALIDQARFLLVPSESGDEFQRRYFDSLQQSPDVVLAHSEVVKFLGKSRSEVH